MEPESILARSILEISAEVAARREAGMDSLTASLAKWPASQSLIAARLSPTRSSLVKPSQAFEHETHRKKNMGAHHSAAFQRILNSLPPSHVRLTSKHAR